MDTITLPPPKPEPERLVSLDAYRGLVMLAMVSGGLGLTQVASHFEKSPVWNFIGYQLKHVEWTGCSAWDLIQPSFMFIVGVAMPFSFASRVARGDSRGSILFHVVWRALVLIALGIFLRSNGRSQTNFTFEDVATQIGLGYAFLFLILGRGWRVQLASALVILIGYWASSRPGHFLHLITIPCNMAFRPIGRSSPGLPLTGTSTSIQPVISTNGFSIYFPGKSRLSSTEVDTKHSTSFLPWER